MTLPTLIVEAGFAGGASTADYLHLDDIARGLLGTGTLAGDDVWEDISAYALSVSMRGGANRVESPILRYEAGTCTIELNNSDRRFDATNLSGPYVSAGVTQVTPMRAIRVRAEWNGVTYDLFRGFADEWTIDYNGPNWSSCVLSCTDATKVLTNYDRSAVSAVGGSEDSGARIHRILDSISWSDIDRVIATGDSTLQSTTLADNAWTELLLTQDTEIGEIYIDAAGRVAFRNRHAAMTDVRSTAPVAVFGDQTQSGIETTLNLCTNPSLETDTTGWATGGSAPPALARSTAQARFGTYSLLATWDTGGFLPLVQYTITGLTVGRTYAISCYVYVPSGSPDVTATIATTGQFTASAGVTDQWARLTWIGPAISATLGFQVWPLSSPTAGDEVYIDGMQVEEGGTVSAYCDGDQANCEWDGTAHASVSRRLPELPYSDVKVSYDGSTLANLVKISRIGGTQQTAEDTASQQLYLTQTYDRTDLLMQTDAAADEYANFVLYQSKDPELRFSELNVAPLRDATALFPQVLGRRYGDRIRILRRPPGGGTITREAFIRGIAHTVTPGDWRTTWTLQSATKWAFLVLDHGTLGALDENALAY